MVRQWQEPFYKNQYFHSSIEQGQPNFVTLANYHEIKGVNIENLLDLKESLELYKDYPNAILFNCLGIENDICYLRVNLGIATTLKSFITYKS